MCMPALRAAAVRIVKMVHSNVAARQPLSRDSASCKQRSRLHMLAQDPARLVPWRASTAICSEPSDRDVAAACAAASSVDTCASDLPKACERAAAGQSSSRACVVAMCCGHACSARMHLVAGLAGGITPLSGPPHLFECLQAAARAR
jgi:hypothetical protein